MITVGSLKFLMYLRLIHYLCRLNVPIKVFMEKGENLFFATYRNILRRKETDTRDDGCLNILIRSV